MTQENLSRKITKNSIWRHYKGNKYIVLGLAKDEATKEDLVIYQDVNVDFKELPWARPVKSFLEVISSDEGTNYYRFEKING